MSSSSKFHYFKVLIGANYFFNYYNFLCIKQNYCYYTTLIICITKSYFSIKVECQVHISSASIYDKNVRHACIRLDEVRLKSFLHVQKVFRKIRN